MSQNPSRIFKSRLSNVLVSAACIVLSQSALADTPTWIGGFAKQSERQTMRPCVATQSIEGDFIIDSWDRQRATGTYLCFEVYARGITDAGYDPAALLVDVTVSNPDNPTEMRSFPARFARRQGNNFVYFVTRSDLMLGGERNVLFRASVRDYAGRLSVDQETPVRVVLQD